MKIIMVVFCFTLIITGCKNDTRGEILDSILISDFFADYLHPELDERLPIIVMISADSLGKMIDTNFNYSADVVFKSQQEIENSKINNYFRLSSYTIHDNEAKVSFWYPIEGIYCIATIIRIKQTWIVTKFKVINN